MAVVKFVPNDVLNIIGGFKLGSMVLYCHNMYMHAVEILADYNLAVQRHTAKLPYFMAIQYGWKFYFFVDCRHLGMKLATPSNILSSSIAVVGRIHQSSKCKLRNFS